MSVSVVSELRMSNRRENCEPYRKEPSKINGSTWKVEKCIFPTCSQPVPNLPIPVTSSIVVSPAMRN